MAEEIDETVFEAFGMAERVRKIVRRRMAELPLNELAAKYRKLWEPKR